VNSNESAKVRLRTLVERNALREERAAPLEVQGLLSSAKDYLADARRQTNSQATRFNVAYEAAHAIALAAMRALDLRPAQGPGHRAVVFNALNSTTGATAAVFVPLMKANDKRNKLTYDGLTTFSAAELAELIDCATALERIVRAEITKHRPELLVPPEASP
jgi:hypothetical protein